MKQIKRRYRHDRKRFKRLMYHEMRKNKALAMLIIETYAAWHHRRHIANIWGMFRNPEYKAFQKDYNENLMGKHLSGRSDIWRSFHFAGYDNLYDYNKRIPETFAMGDALSVAYSVLKEKQNTSK